MDPHTPPVPLYYIMELSSAHFNLSSRNKENLFCSGKMELSSSNIKKVVSFSQKKAFLIFQELETLKEFLIFSKKKAVLVFRKTETLKKLLMF